MKLMNFDFIDLSIYLSISLSVYLFVNTAQIIIYLNLIYKKYFN